MFGKKVKTQNIGVRKSYADIAETIADIFKLEKLGTGHSFW